MARMSDVPPKGGFSFDLCRRNEMLLKKGIQLPSFRKTGTTIVGLVFQDGIVLGADTRATEGPIVADKNCEKIHYMAPNIYCCGAGTAADTEAVTDMVSSQLQLHRYATGRESRVIAALTLLKSHLFSYQGHVSAALVLGGVDVTGHICTLFTHMDQPILSLSLQWVLVLLLQWLFSNRNIERALLEMMEYNLSARQFVLAFSMIWAAGAMSMFVSLRKVLKKHQLPNPRTYVSTKGYNFVKGHTEVLATKIKLLKPKAEVPEGDSMEE
uniref:Proteasome subunit beta n=1 Tax=Ananas comosus var. bracteatus TaxID=296719 RepID=A0A6V7PGH7_ANACO|nr:unnamed protein product [Ananas comosus var. bracteatus]